MKHVFRNRDGARQTVARDAHNPSQVYILTETNDKAVLEKNHRIRTEQVYQQDSRNPLVDGDVVAFAFQFPTNMDYALVKRKEPDLFHRIEMGGDDGVRAAEALALLYPQYVVTHKREDRPRF